MKYSRFLRLIVFSFVLGCASEGDLDLQGHRGCRGLFPENSIPGFLHALEMGVSTLELDVHISKDGQVVVCHDPYLPAFCMPEKWSDGLMALRPKVADYTANELRDWECGTLPNAKFPHQRKMESYIPTLEEVFQVVETAIRTKGLSPVRYNIEIKSTLEGDTVFHPEVNEFVRLVLEVIEKANLKNRTIIQSFDIRALKAVHAGSTDWVLALLVDENEDFQEKMNALGFKPQILSPYYKLITEQMIGSAHDAGIQVIPWTVNTRKEAEQLVELNIDGIITDYPDSLMYLKKN
ncbi:MAG: glycerophosphodiester phosphodiesterase family protein [Flavobacteriales bacterium]